MENESKVTISLELLLLGDLYKRNVIDLEIYE